MTYKVIHGGNEVLKNADYRQAATLAKSIQKRCPGEHVTVDATIAEDGASPEIKVSIAYKK